MPETVLLVDDNEINREKLEETLKLHSFRTVCVNTPTDVTSLLGQVEIDLVIVNNFTKQVASLIRYIRNNENYTHIPVLVVSENDSLEQKISGFESGIDDYITQPFVDALLIAKIKAILKFSRMEKKMRAHTSDLERKVIERGRKIIRTRSEAKQVSVINEIMNIISSDINISGVVRAVSHEIGKLIHFSRISIVLKQSYEEKLTLFIQEKNNPDKIITRSLYLSATNGPGKVFFTHKTLIQPDIWLETNSKLEFEQVLSSDTRSAVIFPLISKGNLIGTLNIGDRMPKFYKKTDVKILEKIINQIAVAIENARLYSEVKELSRQLQITVDQRNEEIEKKYCQLSLLNKVSHAMQGTLDLNNLLNLILTYVTAGGAISFNRAILLSVNYEKGYIEGVMGVGPSSWEEAWQIWDKLYKENWKIDDFLEHYDNSPSRISQLSKIAKEIKIPLSEKSDFLVMSVMEKRSFLISGASSDKRVNQFIKDKLKAEDFVITPLLARDKVIGIIIADNLFSGKVIDEDSRQLLNIFANQAGLAFERANAYEKLTLKIQELKDAYEALKETQSKLLRSERLAMIGKMAAHVAHEIRNPLTTIGGFAHVMFKFPHDPQKIKRNSQIIREEVYRLENILQSVLDFTKPASPIFELGDVNSVIENTLILLQKDVKNNKITLKKNLGHNLPKILLDSEQIKQSLINIYKNAVYSIVKSIKKGTDENTLSIQTKIKKDYIKIKIEDTGDGMPPHVMENLFNPFFTTKEGGSGLGLAVTHKIIEDHGGFIDVKSQLGEGSEFIVYLPLRTELHKIKKEG